MNAFQTIRHFPRQRVALLLMTTSMAMLLVFQGLWLRKVYEESKNGLQREADNVFGETLREMQDSLINARILKPLDIAGKGMDTAVILTLQNVLRLEMTRGEKGARIIQRDIRPAKALADSSFGIQEVRISINGDSAQRLPQLDKNTAVFFTKATDSLGLPPFHDYWIQDTIALANIQSRYDLALQTAGIAVHGRILQAPRPGPVREDSVTAKITTTPMPAGLPPRIFYYAVIENYDPYLFQKIVPQGLFSLFLLLITGLAFGFIYRSLRQQQRLAALKNDFISNVAHELKTPIATVGVAIESLRNFDAMREPERAAEYLDISKHELNRLSMLVDKVLKMAIFEQKEPDLHYENFDLRQLLEEVLGSMKLQFERTGATTIFNCEGQNFQIEGDRIHLTNVVYNLLDNALKYSKDAAHITVELKEAPPEIQLSVKDRGIGISQEYLGKVFEKFFRVPTGDRHDVKGYGLGLSYVSSVVAKHGGRIEVESIAGKGSHFVIHIPRKHGKD